MKNRKVTFNPAKFSDMLGEKFYASGRSRKRKRQKLVGWLRKKGKHSKSCLQLAEKLDDCRADNRCGSPACPECASAAQRLIAKVARKFLKAQVGKDMTVVCVTVVPADGMINPDKLSAADHDRAIRRWKEKLGKAGVEWFIGATDISMNEHKHGQHKPKWSEHLYGITVTKRPGKLKRALKEQFPKTKAVRRPVKVEEWDGDKQALRYILKPKFSRRIETDDGQRYDKKTGTARSCRDTDTQPLKSKQKLQLLLYLDGIGMQGRLFLRWCQLLNKKGKRPTIVMRPPKGRGPGNR